MELKYHYVVFSYPRDYFRVMFHDAIENNSIEYISDPIVDAGFNKFICWLNHKHRDPYLNWLFTLPFQNKWFKYYYSKKVDKPICFVFLMDWFTPQKLGFIDVLRTKYPDAKFAIYLEDLVASHRFVYDEAKKADIIISYDQGDAEKYDFHYLPTFLSKINIHNNLQKHSDCCFIGLAKNRTKIINEVFERLTKHGVSCDFIVSSKNNVQLSEGIQFIKTDMSYLDYLQHVVDSDCIIEIMQKNATGYTLRTWEALLYGKKLLTNNPDILKAPFYNSKQFIYFQNSEDIDLDILTRKEPIPEYAKESISPMNLIRLIESNL